MTVSRVDVVPLRELIYFEAGLLFSGKRICQMWQQRHRQILCVLILRKKPELSCSSFSFKICFPSQWVVSSVSLLCTYNLSIPLSFSEVNDLCIDPVEFFQLSLQAVVSRCFLRAVSGCV